MGYNKIMQLQAVAPPGFASQLFNLGASGLIMTPIHSSTGLYFPRETRKLPKNRIIPRLACCIEKRWLRARHEGYSLLLFEMESHVAQAGLG